MVDWLNHIHVHVTAVCYTSVWRLFVEAKFYILASISRPSPSSTINHSCDLWPVMGGINTGEREWEKIWKSRLADFSMQWHVHVYDYICKVMTDHFLQVAIIKPMTSCPTSPERFLVCRGFTGCKSILTEVHIHVYTCTCTLCLHYVYNVHVLCVYTTCTCTMYLSQPSPSHCV